MDVCVCVCVCECWVLPGRGLCDKLITRPEESYRLWCVVCDLETSKEEEAKSSLKGCECKPTMGCDAGRKKDEDPYDGNSESPKNSRCCTLWLFSVAVLLKEIITKVKWEMARSNKHIVLCSSSLLTVLYRHFKRSALTGLTVTIVLTTIIHCLSNTRN